MTLQNLKKKILTNLMRINNLYIDYILSIMFLNIIILKINQNFLNISSVYIYPGIILISIIFIKQIKYITNVIKNSYLFNFLLYYFLIFKNNIYKCVYEIISFLNYEKDVKLIIFLSVFILNSWILNVLFLILNFSYDLSILLFVFLLILNIFNLIENRIIFTSENLIKNPNIDYNVVKKDLLKINNNNFNKNIDLFYIQKRYINFGETKTFLKQHMATILTGVTTSTIFTGYIQFNTYDLKKRELNQNKENDDRQLDFQERSLKFQKKKTYTELLVKSEDQLLQYDRTICDLSKINTDLKISDNTSSFWSGVKKNDLSKDINENESEIKNIKERRSSFNEKFTDLKNNPDFFYD